MKILSPTAVGALAPAGRARPCRCSLRVVAGPGAARSRLGLSSFSLPLYCSPNSSSITSGSMSSSAGERADVDDVLEQLALARVAVGGVADLGERHADDVDVVAELRRRQRLGAVVEQVAAGLDLLHVGVPGLRVHRHHQVDAAAPPEPAVLVDAHLVPGRQALDVGREDVARADRHAHAQDRLARTARWPTPSPSR